jgi:hypothetical protein
VPECMNAMVRSHILVHPLETAPTRLLVRGESAP